MGNQTTEQEDAVLSAADDLLRITRGTVRHLDVIAKAVAAYTSDERVRKAWAAVETSINAMGYAQDPEAYCDSCKGKGERMVSQKCCDGRDCGCYGRGSSYLDACTDCGSNGFIGYQKTTPVPSLYAPGDEALEPAF